jgi:hypothetical protein
VEIAPNRQYLELHDLFPYSPQKLTLGRFGMKNEQRYRKKRNKVKLNLLSEARKIAIDRTAMTRK